MRWVPKQTVVEAVVAAGCPPPSDDQLDRLARGGLLQRPRQRYPVGVRGSLTEYPHAAVDQAVGVFALHMDVHRLDNLRFWAFWEGLWVESRQIRKTLAGQVHSGHRSGRGQRDPFDDAERLVYRHGDSDAWSNRLGHKSGVDAQSAAFTLLLAVLNGGPAWDYEPQPETTSGYVEELGPTELVEKTLRLGELAVPIGTHGALVDEPPHPGAPLAQIAETGLGDPRTWVTAIRTVPIVELNSARDTARALVEDLTSIAELASLAGIGRFPARLIREVRGPQGRGASAIRHCAAMIEMGLVVNRLEPRSVVQGNIEAIRFNAARMRDDYAAALGSRDQEESTESE